MHHPPPCAIKHKFSLSEAAKEIVTETLVLIAKGDAIIPNHHSHETADCLAGVCTVKEFSDVDHNELPFSAEAISAVNSFIISPSK